MPDFSLPPKRKQTTLIIDGQHYISESFISLNDMIMLTVYLTIGNADYYYAVADLIQSKIICEESQRPSVHQIATQGDALFVSYITTLLEEDYNLKSSYEKFAEEENSYYRLILSVDDEWKEYGQSLAAGLYKINIPEFDYEVVQNFLLEFSAKIKSEFEPISSILANISGFLTGWAKRIEDQIKTVISDIHILTFSEGKKWNSASLSNNGVSMDGHTSHMPCSVFIIKNQKVKRMQTKLL